jgi:recombination protein RecA
MPKTFTTKREQEIRAMRLKHSTSSRAPAVVEVIRPKPGGDKKLAQLLAKLSKKYKGEEVFTTIANGSRASNIKATPSGWAELDDLLTGETDAEARTIPGTGLGWPRGRIIEVYGEEFVGKTTLTCHIIAAFQRAGERAAFVDAEHALDVHYAKQLGVDFTTLQFSQPTDGGERALDVVRDMCASGLFGVIVVDSVAALEPQSELEADFEDNAQPGNHARLMSRALRRLTSVVAQSNTLLVFTNQQRMKIGVRFGNPKTTTGGQALKFYASVRLEMTNMGAKKKSGRTTHRRTRIRTVKNKCAPPFRDVFCDVAPNKGIFAVYADPDFGGDDKDDSE